MTPHRRHGLQLGSGAANGDAYSWRLLPRSHWDAVMTIEFHALGAGGYAAPRTADVVLYLDLDGVVHHEAVYWHHKRGIHMSSAQAPDHKLFEWLPLLEAALCPYPDVRLVLSSSWCVRPGFGKTMRRLPESLRARFLGGTYHKRVHGIDNWAVDCFQARSRAEQILADVARRRPRHWLALDDDVVEWPHRYSANLVACDGSSGLSDARVQHELAQKLRACHSGDDSLARVAVSG